MRFLRILNLLLLLALVLGAAFYWGQLPDRIPTHFNARGVPDAWSATHYGSWFLLPAIAVFMVGVMYLTMWGVQRRPDLLNIPQKKDFLELQRQDQEPVLRVVVELLELVTLLVLLMFCLIQVATWRAAFSESVRGLMLGVMLLSVIGLPALVILILLRTRAAIRAARRRAQLQGRL